MEKSLKLTTLIDFQIDSNLLYNFNNATFLAYGEAFSASIYPILLMFCRLLQQS